MKCNYIVSVTDTEKHHICLQFLTEQRDGSGSTFHVNPCSYQSASVYYTGFRHKKNLSDNVPFQTCLTKAGDLEQVTLVQFYKIVDRTKEKNFKQA